MRRKKNRQEENSGEENDKEKVTVSTIEAGDTARRVFRLFHFGSRGFSEQCFQQKNNSIS
jgi:hypothetical protein